MDQNNIYFKNKQIPKYIKLPYIGMRIIKTAIAVFFCCVIYYLRGYQGMVSASAIAAIICMQTNTEKGISEGIDRMIGTFIGAFWGLLFCGS